MKKWNPSVGEFLREFPHSISGWGLGVAGLSCPLWIPFADGRPWTLPRTTAEGLAYIMFMALGALTLWFRWRGDDGDSSD